MKDPNQTQTHEATPEQLLRVLESQLGTQRSQRAGPGRNRAMIVVIGLLFIVIVAGVALLVLDQMLSDLRQRGPDSAPAPKAAIENF